MTKPILIPLKDLFEAIPKAYKYITGNPSTRSNCDVEVWAHSAKPYYSKVFEEWNSTGTSEVLFATSWRIQVKEFQNQPYDKCIAKRSDYVKESE